MKVGETIPAGPLFSAIPGAEIQLSKVSSSGECDEFKITFMGVYLGEATKTGNVWEVLNEH